MRFRPLKSIILLGGGLCLGEGRGSPGDRVPPPQETIKEMVTDVNREAWLRLEAASGYPCLSNKASKMDIINV